MEFKPFEIVAIVVALAIPIGLFVILLVPGAGGAIYAFAMDRQNMPYVFGLAAGALICVLGYRVFRRIRPASRRRDDDH